MKLKILTTIVLLLLGNLSLFLIIDNNTVAGTGFDNPNVKEVRVAMLSEFPISGWGEALPFFIAALEDYQWTVMECTYKFNLTKIYDKDILSGKLTTASYDMLLVPGGGVGDSEAWTKGFSHIPKDKKWREAIAEFVKEGGGYVGYCGGAMLMAEIYGAPRTFMERQYQTSSPGVSCVKQVFGGIHSFSHPERGPPAYTQFHQNTSQNISRLEDCAKVRIGVPLDISICKDNPIFSDFPNASQRIMWVGGPAFVLTDNPNREINVLARYPAEEMSDNLSTQIHQWKYIGGLRGYLRGFLKGIRLCRENQEPFSNAFSYSYFLASDWKPTDEIIKINLSGKPCMTSEVYPNENQARIVLTGLHPEYPVWWGGHIENVDDTKDNCFVDGLYKWVDIKPFNQTSDVDISHNWWMIRRQVAWAAKVPDKDLPPAFVALQVSDI